MNFSNIILNFLEMKCSLQKKIDTIWICNVRGYSPYVVDTVHSTLLRSLLVRLRTAFFDELIQPHQS